MKVMLAAALILGLTACTPSRTPPPVDQCAVLPGLLLEAEYQADYRARDEARWRAWGVFYQEKVGDPATSAAYAVAEALSFGPGGGEGYLSALQRAKERVAKQCGK